MKKNILLAAVALTVLVLAVLAYQVFKTPDQASAPIAAVPVTVETPTTAAATVATATEPADESPAETAAPTEAPAAAPVAAPRVFEIVQAQSQARFIIDEVLRGAPKTVIGATDQVAGQIAIDPANPATTQVGEILVNARTLATDNDFRNRAVKNQILSTNNFEYISFKPRQLVGLPDSVTVGQEFTFQIAGDLTVRDVTKEVTFDVTVTPTDENTIIGLATLSVPYTDFGITIPNAPGVVVTTPDVRLELDFTAVAQ